jgi:hypothetical protein
MLATFRNEWSSYFNPPSGAVLHSGHLYTAPLAPVSRNMHSSASGTRAAVHSFADVQKSPVQDRKSTKPQVGNLKKNFK